MNLISNIISEKLIHSFGWTLIHSIWQGAAAALGFALLMVAMRRCSSRTRYFAGIMALLLVLGMAAVTFTTVYNSYEPTAGTLANGTAAVTPTGTTEPTTFTSTGAMFRNYFNRHLPLVVTIWFLGILVLVLRFTGGFLYNQRLKVRHTRPLPEAWQKRLQVLCDRAKIRQTVHLLESAMIKVPMAIGHIKPVILFPVGMVTGLPRDQVEALLAHELAHILRKDYLSNILQSAVDILFFHHPGVRWISSYVRTERENCCDDIAAVLSGDSMNVAKALTNIQDYGLQNVGPAMAAAGKTNGLFNRVKRLADPPRRISRFSEGVIGAFILVVCLFSMVMISNAAPGMSRGMENPDHGLMTQESTVTKDEYEIKKKKEQELKTQEEEEKARQEVLKTQEEEEKKLEQMEKEMQLKKMELMKQKEVMQKQKEELKKQNKELSAEQREKWKAMYKELQVRELELQKKQKEMEIRQKKLQFEVQKKLKLSEEDLKIKQMAMEEKQKELKLKQEQLKKQQKVYDIIGKNLFKDKLIDTSNQYQFKLSAAEMTINGVKQPQDIFEKYKKLFESLTGNTLERAIMLQYSADKSKIDK